MNKQILDSEINQNSIRFFLAAIFLLLASFSAGIQAASPMQDGLRKRVYGDEKSKPKPQPKKPTDKRLNKQTNKQTIVQSKKKTKVSAFNKPAAPKKREDAKKSSTNRTNRPKQALLSVTFTALQPNSEIWINGRNVGQTDESAKFSKKLAPNFYRVAVRKGNQIVFPVKTILVTVGQTDFKLFVEAAVQKTPEPRPAPPVVAETRKSPEESTRETSDRIKRILEDYTDPVKTDTVSLRDWELVFQSSQLGYLQGFTAVQIDAQRWLASGQIELARGNYTNAFTAFAKSKEFMRESALPFYGLGNTYIANNQPAEALKAFQQAARLEPKMAIVYKGIGDAQRLLKNKKGALAAYKSAVQLGYIAPEIRFRLATMLLETERTKEGLKELEELAETAPTAEIYVAIGDGYQQLKQNVTAIEFYRKAIENKSDLAVAHFKLGSIYFDEREYPKAKENLEKALELDPDGKNFNSLNARKKARLAASKIK